MFASTARAGKFPAHGARYPPNPRAFRILDPKPSLAAPPSASQFLALLRANPGAVILINAANELVNLGGGLGNRYALLLAPLSLVQAAGSTTTLLRLRGPAVNP